MTNYRRKDYFVPRSMKEAYGRDDTLEPEIRCCSELFNQKRNLPVLPFVFVFVIAVLLLVQVIVKFAY